MSILDFQNAVMTTLNMEDGDFSKHYGAPNYILYSYEKLVGKAIDNACEELRDALDSTFGDMTVQAIWWRIFTSLNIRINIAFDTSKRTPDQMKSSYAIIIAILKEFAGEGVDIQEIAYGDTDTYNILMSQLENTEKLKNKFEQELRDGIDRTPFDFPEGEEEAFKEEVFARLTRCCVL